MLLIRLETFIKAPPSTLFDLSRSVDLHRSSMKLYQEEIIDGVREGLPDKNDTITGRAKHLFRTREMKVRLTEIRRPLFFADEMMNGDFKSMRYEHHFTQADGGTLMTDRFFFETPFGYIGKMFEAHFLRKYMTRLLVERNNETKRIAESNLWQQYLKHD